MSNIYQFEKFDVNFFKTKANYYTPKISAFH